MEKDVVGCPKCGKEKRTERILGSEFMEGDCGCFEVQFVAATWRDEKRRAFA